MTPRRALVLGLVACTVDGIGGFHRAALRIPGNFDLGSSSSSSSSRGDDKLRGGAFKSSIPLSSRELGGRSARGVRGIRELRASGDHPSSAPDKEARRRKVSVKQAVELWAADNLDLHRFNTKRVHVCKAETLPEVLSEFWQLTSECAQDKYSAMTSGRDHAAHVLFVVARCDLLKDYGMMRHLDKVLDFCSGGCRDFGRTLTLQHYHPSFVLPPSQDRAADRSGDLARVTDFSRSPYPAFGLTVAGGSATRSDPLEVGDKMGRLRLDLELAYNSVAGCSTDDSVDAHGSEHGTIPSSPIEVEEKMTGWLSKFSTAPEGGAASGGHHGRYLGSAEDFVTSGFRTPEEVLSQIWSIVSQLQSKAAPALAKERSSPAGTEAAGQAKEGGGVEVGGEGEGEREEEQREPLASTLLVAPRLHPFNAAEFENFGLNLAIALKQTPIMDRIEIEIYHPEFVCDGGIVDPLRRSPFPTLLVKHCGLKDELFEPSGMYRHAVPPLKLPLEASPPTAEGDVGVDGSADGDTDPSSSSPETSTDTSADGAQL